MHLEQVDLSNLDLRNINFKCANLRYCNLSNCDLTSCVFERADMYKANLDVSPPAHCISPTSRQTLPCFCLGNITQGKKNGDKWRLLITLVFQK